eukprot:TRINITY_DN1644_c0_g1_i7.p1 TRINITY_DN1644_c0_g1~~TRINITY_DN1644_c0_g1_i7.p1  ORF type:complete len:1023 (+),score=302.12 TRINITY_DN1644_c0_g1_i7:1489-4557(+)
MHDVPQGSVPDSIITYEEALSRFGDGGSEALNDFKQITKGEPSMSFDVFLKSFIGSVFPAVPPQLARALFRAFDMERSQQISKKNFVQGLAILRNGTAEERLKLVFTAYDSDYDGYIEKSELIEYIKLFQGDVELIIQELEQFEQTRLGLDDFSVWATRTASTHPCVPLSVVVWMYEFDDLLRRQGIRAHHYNLVHNKPRLKRSEVRSRSISETLGLSHAKVEGLQTVYKSLLSLSPTGIVDEETFKTALPSIPDELKSQMFRALDVTKTSSVSLQELLAAVAVCCHGTAEEKLAFCFRLFDSDDDGHLTKADFKKMIESLWNVETLYRSVNGRDASTMLSPRVTPKVQLLLDTAFPPGKTTMTTDELLAWTVDHEFGMQFTQAVWQVAFIDLRVRPSTPEEEREIIENLNTTYTPENPGPVGTIWCLIDATWWHEWRKCVKPETAKPDENWVGTTAMPQLDNKRLLDDMGRLRRNIDWAGEDGGKHYEVITQGAWRALASWYGGVAASEIARTVVEIDGRKVLELHPPRLSIVKGSPSYPFHTWATVETAFSGVAKFCEVAKAAAELFELDPQDVVLWEESDRWTRVSARKMEETLMNHDVTDGSSFMVGAASDEEPVSYTRQNEAVTVKMDPKSGVMVTVGDTTHREIDAIEQEGDAMRCSTGTLVKLPSPDDIKIFKELQALLKLSGVETNFAEDSQNKTGALEHAIEKLTSGMRVECYAYSKAGQRSNKCTRGTVLGVKQGRVKVLPLYSESAIVIPRDWVTKKLEQNEKSSFGKVGLQNLTNTCYLNATIQALSHTRLLREYFLSDLYTYDLNTSSQWGMNGKLAVGFTELIEKLWTADRQFLAPRFFRNLVGVYRSDFASNQQQDANEFLLALLEGVGEDVNRVKRKQTLQLKLKSEDATDQELADESWQAHTARENSFLTMLFAWQHKSTRTCKGCGKATVAGTALLRPRVREDLPAQTTPEGPAHDTEAGQQQHHIRADHRHLKAARRHYPTLEPCRLAADTQRQCLRAASLEE